MCSILGQSHSSLHSLSGQDEGEDEDSDEDAKPPAEELAGVRVRHNADALNEGETMILTMADRNILDDRGELAEDADELENVSVVRDLSHATPLCFARVGLVSSMCPSSVFRVH